MVWLAGWIVGGLADRLECWSFWLAGWSIGDCWLVGWSDDGFGWQAGVFVVLASRLEC